MNSKQDTKGCYQEEKGIDRVSANHIERHFRCDRKLEINNSEKEHQNFTMDKKLRKH